MSKKIAAYLKSCDSMDDLDPEDPQFNMSIGDFTNEALAYSHELLKKYIKVAEPQELDLLEEMSTLLTVIRQSTTGALGESRELIVLMEKWLKQKEGEGCEVSQKQHLLLSIALFLKALPLRIESLNFLIRKMVPSDLVPKINTLSKAIKKNLKRLASN